MFLDKQVLCVHRCSLDEMYMCFIQHAQSTRTNEIVPFLSRLAIHCYQPLTQCSGIFSSALMHMHEAELIGQCRKSFSSISVYFFPGVSFFFFFLWSGVW